MDENLNRRSPSHSELSEERDRLVALVAAQRDALEAATAYVELFTKNGTRKQPPSWAIKPDRDYDAQEISDRARAVLQTLALPHAACVLESEAQHTLRAPVSSH